MRQAADELTEYCRDQALSWELQYSEAENTYYASVSGIGIGEFWEIKRISDPERALVYMLARLKEARANKLARPA